MMNVVPKKPLAAAIASLAILSASARETNSWQAVDGSYDGKWSEVGHWSLGRLPAGDDYVEFDGDHSDAAMSYTVEVDGDHLLEGEFCVGRDGKNARKQGVTFSGSGSVTFVGTIAEHSIRYYAGGVTLDGPSFSFKTPASKITLFTPLTVKGGSRLDLSGMLTFWHWISALDVEAGGVVNVQTVVVRTGDTSGGLTVGKGGSFVCRGNLIYGFNSTSAKPFAIDVDGGDVWCNQLRFNLSNRDVDTVTVRNGGWLTAWKGVAFTDRAKQLSVDATSHFLEPSDVTQGDATYALMTARRHEVVSCKQFNAVDGQTFRQRGTLCVSKLKNNSAAKPMHIDCDRLVFDGSSQPIDWTTTREVHFYGPMEIQATADVKTYTNENGYRHCHGAVVVNTADWVDPATKRTIVIRGFASADGSLDLTVTGGGTFETCQSQYSVGSSMRSCRVEADTTLRLQNRAAFSQYGQSVTDWCALTTEKLILEDGAKVVFNAGLNYVCASKWQVDGTACFEVTVPNNVPADVCAMPILQDLDSKPLPSEFLNRIVLSGSTSGWSLKNEYGQITLWRDPSTAVGIYSNPSGSEYEWKGGTVDAGLYKFSKTDNWVDASSIGERKKFTFGASQYADVLFDNIPGVATTVGQFCFQTNAVRSFFIDGYNQATFQSDLDHAMAVESYSAVPQVLACGLRMVVSNDTTNRTLKTRGTGPIVFSRYKADGATAARTWLAKNNDFKVTVDGDVRVGCGMNAADEEKRFGLVLSPRNTIYPCYRTCLTVIDGGNLLFPKQKDGLKFANPGTTLRVSKGGQLTFPTEAHYYCWEDTPAAIIVDGTLNIGTRFTGGCARIAYGGSGTINIMREIQPNSKNTLFAFGDALQVNVSSNRWPSEGRTMGSAQLATAIGAVSGSPTFHVPAGWVYGPTVASPQRSLADRALRVENGAEAVFEPNGGTATLDDCVTGFGTVAVTNGTLFVKAGLLNATEEDLGFKAQRGATLEFADSQSFGSLTLENGATLRMPATASLSLEGDASLDGATLDVGAQGTAWRTLITAKGRISGTPTVLGEGVKIRTVASASGVSLQAKEKTGLVLTIR